MFVRRILRKQPKSNKFFVYPFSTLDKITFKAKCFAEWVFAKQPTSGAIILIKSYHLKSIFVYAISTIDEQLLYYHFVCRQVLWLGVGQIDNDNLRRFVWCSFQSLGDLELFLLFYKRDNCIF